MCSQGEGNKTSTEKRAATYRKAERQKGKPVNTNEFRFDHHNKKIIITKSFDMAARKPSTKEYELLRTLQADFPQYSISLRTAKAAKNKNTYRGLSYRRMEAYIQSVEGDNSATALAVFEKEKQNPKFVNSPYAHMKKWFLDRYPAYKPEDSKEETDSAAN